jgi:PAS domain S-box-containing protein
LLVEDSPADAALVIRVLQQAGFTLEVERVASAFDLIEALASRVWDLLISDHSLPGFGGREALTLLHRSGHQIPFLVVSGTIGEEMAVDMLKAGADDFILKDHLARLPLAVERALEQAAARRARLRAEAELRASEERLRTVMDSLGDVVFTTDSALRHTRVFGTRMTTPRRTADSLVGRRPEDLWPPDVADAHATAMRKALDGERALCEWSLEGPEGTRRYQTAFSPLKSESGQIEGVVGVERDVTAQRELEVQLAASDRLASVGMIAAGVAHEINNPLAALIANLELLHQELKGVRRFAELDDAREAAGRLRAIVADISVFSRPHAEENTAVELAGVLESSVRVAATETRHVATVHLEPIDVPPVLGNTARLGQLFLNLVVNAAQAMPEGHASNNEIRLRAYLGEGPHEGKVVVEVKDTGVGMSPEVLRRMRDPFFTTKPIGRGTGLGLAICQRIVDSLGGELSAESVLGVGSTFRVALPMTGERAQVSSRTSRFRTRGPRTEHRVLIVDDERLVLNMLQRLLSFEYEVTAVSRAAEAAERITAGERFDLILCDVMMPDMTGMALHAFLRDAAPGQAERMVFVTGGAYSLEAQAFLEHVSNPHLEKPFDIEVLQSMVRARIEALGSSAT